MNRGLAANLTHTLVCECRTFPHLCSFLTLHLLISRAIMAENPKAQAPESDSFLQPDDWVAMLTGGLITSGAIGWSVYKSHQLDYKEIIPLAVNFVGGMGIYFSCKAIISLSRKSRDSQRKPETPKTDASDLNTLRYETSKLITLLDRANDWDKIFAHEASETKECEVLGKKISNCSLKNIFKAPSECKTPMDRFREWQRHVPRKLRTDNQMKTCYNEGIGSSKAKIREKFISYINELKGYVKGTIDPLPLARSIQFRSNEMSDENRRQIVTIVKEYVSSLSPKLGEVTDEFVNSVCKDKVLNDKEHKMKKAFETLGVPEDWSTEPLKIEMSQYYNALENATRNPSQMFSYQNGPKSSRNTSGASIRQLESGSSPSLHERDIWTKISRPPNSMTPRLATPTTTGIPLKSQGVSKPNHRANANLKSPHSKPLSKLILTQEQMNLLNILKSEL